MDAQQVTAQIMGAWDELQAEEDEAAETVDTEAEPDSDEDDESQESGEEANDEAEEPAEDEDEEDGDEGDEEDEDEEEAEQPSPAYEDTEIQAFLAKYGGDVDAALKGAADLQRVLGRQGSEKNQLAQRVAELEDELQRARAFSGVGPAVSEEQRVWIEEAVNSANPGAYVNGAIHAGEFELARAVCREWSREDPYTALRSAQFVDQAQAHAQQQADPLNGPIDTGVLLNALADNFPEMRQHEASMVGVLARLGPAHPLVMDAQSGDLERAARAILSIYEIARGSATQVKSTRDGIRRKQREAADDVRQAAVVSSASAAPSVTETPRPTRLGPGLTLEALEAEFSRPGPG